MSAPGSPVGAGPSMAARVPTRWCTLHATMERLNAAARPRFVSMLVLLVSTIAGLAVAVAWLAR